MPVTKRDDKGQQVGISDEELLNKLFEMVIVQGKSLTKSLAEIGYDRSNFYKRLVKPGHEDFASRIEELRKAAMEVMEDVLTDISDNDKIHWSVRKDMIDVRKWMLATREPRFRE